MFFFFFKHKTAYEMRISDWSSDVCSSDLIGARGVLPVDRQGHDREGRHEAEESQGNSEAGPPAQRKDQCHRRDREGEACRIGGIFGETERSNDRPPVKPGAASGGRQGNAAGGAAGGRKRDVEGKRG